MNLRCASLLAALALGGCFRTSYQTALPPGGPSHHETVRYALWGLAGSKDVDLDAVCPKGVHSFGTYASFGDLVLTGITLGIYSPRTVEVDCALEPQP